MSKSVEARNELMLKTRFSEGCRLRVVPIVVGLALLMLLSNVSVRPTSEAIAAQTTLRVGMLEPIDSLNPFIGINDNAYVFYGLVYDFLIAVDEDMKPKPNLAESWNIVQDQLPVGSVWQYNLTRNATWHDGEPLTADDVIFTMDYQSGENWYTVWAYQPYTLMINWTEKIDDFTVRIHFYNPVTKQPTAIAFGESLMIPIVPKHLWEGIPPADAAFGYSNPKPVGTGPFMCTDRTEDEFLSGERLILYKNPSYHLGPVSYDRLVLEFYLEPAAMVMDIQRGALDLAAFATPTYKNLMDWLEKNPTDSIGYYSGLSCTSYSVMVDINQNRDEGGGTNWLRHDPALRKALAYATNKTFIRDHIYMGYADIGYSLFSKTYGDWYWEPNASEAYEFNITKANEILDEAGYYWDGDFRRASDLNEYRSNTFELKFNVLVETELFEDQLTALFLKEQWAQIGVQLNPIFIDSAGWNNYVYNSGSFDMAMTYWSGDPDPNYLLYTQSTDALSGWSENYYSSAEYDENYTQSILHVTQEERLPYVHNCLRHIYNDCAFIVNVYPHGCWAWRTDHFDGWGDWGAHPGRQLSNFWSANDLFFDLVPKTTNQPPTAVLDAAGGHVSDSILITAYAWDPEGDSLGYFLEFGDGTNESGTVPTGGDLTFHHTYTVAGVHSINMTVNDSISGDISRNSVYVAEAGSNVPPTNVRLLPDPMKGFSLSLDATFKLTARDDDGDALHVEIDFADESTNFSDEVTDTEQMFTRTADHKYMEPGDYVLELNVSDGTNYTTAELAVTVAKEKTSSLLPLIIGVVVVAAVVAVVALLVMRRKPGMKKMKEEEDVRLP